MTEATRREERRRCSRCGSDTTILKDDLYPHWYKIEYGTGFLCKPCWNNIYSKLIADPKRINYKGKERMSLREKPRTGTCTECWRTIGVGNRLTRTIICFCNADDPSNPLDGAFELCVPCFKQLHTDVALRIDAYYERFAIEKALKNQTGFDRIDKDTVLVRKDSPILRLILGVTGDSAA